MSGDPGVSVIIPSYNRRDALRRCLDALDAQTTTGFEVIIVDDGSNDGTLEALRERARTDGPYALRPIRNGANLGANRSRNVGIRAAKGDLVAFLDSDCVPATDWIETITSAFDEPLVAAATGVVEEDKPRNIYESVLWGMNRVHGDGDAPRLVAGNLCVRRKWLLRFPFDEDLKYGCDEEGLFLKLRAVGAVQRLVARARVTHEHRFNRKSFFRLGWVGGKAAAWLVFKYHRPPRVDLIPLLLAYLTLPLAILGRPWLAVPGIFLALQLAALAYNDLWRKKKSLWVTMSTLPLLIAFYHVRLAAYVMTSVKLRTGKNDIARISLRDIASRMPSDAGSHRDESDQQNQNDGLR